ncbi:Crp/Fnr family transcriptional regulator [Methylorubrum extorquens]
MQEHAQTIRAGLVRRLNEADVLDAAGRDALLSLPLQPRRVEARTDIAGSNDPRGAHLILSGVAYRYEIMPDGVRRIVALYFPGDLCFSRLPIPTGPRGTLEALCDSAVTDLPSRMLQSLTETHPAIGRALWWLTSIELDIARQWLVLAGRFADQRVAHLVCEILARMSAASTGLTDTVPNHFRQTILADITAISTVHVNRVLQALRVSRLIALKRGIITVEDHAGLAALADFDPGYLHLPEAKTPHRFERAPRTDISSVVPTCCFETGHSATRQPSTPG